MKTLPMLLAAVLATTPMLAAADPGDRNPLAGPKLGIEVVRDANEVRQATGATAAKRNGFGVRGFAGYDAALGGVAIVGAEIGIGKGGRTTDQASLAGGRYRVDPGLTYDATARLGFTPVSGLLIYGRGGYRWLQVKRTIAGQAAGNGIVKATEKGITYGGGLEYALTEHFGLRAEFNRTNYDRNLKQNRVSVGASIRF